MEQRISSPTPLFKTLQGGRCRIEDGKNEGKGKNSSKYSRSRQKENCFDVELENHKLSPANFGIP